MDNSGIDWKSPAVDVAVISDADVATEVASDVGSCNGIVCGEGVAEVTDIEELADISMSL